MNFQYPSELSSFTIPTNTVDSICETAARILFMTIKWTKSIPAFVGLPHRDQLILIEESWRDLFILSLAQFRLPVQPHVLIPISGNTLHQQSCPFHWFGFCFFLVLIQIILSFSILYFIN